MGVPAAEGELDGTDRLALGRNEQVVARDLRDSTADPWRHVDPDRAGEKPMTVGRYSIVTQAPRGHELRWLVGLRLRGGTRLQRGVPSLRRGFHWVRLMRRWEHKRGLD